MTQLCSNIERIVAPDRENAVLFVNTYFAYYSASSAPPAIMEAAVEQSICANRKPGLEIQKSRLEDFALKRKFASLSAKLDRVHRQVVEVLTLSGT